MAKITLSEGKWLLRFLKFFCFQHSTQQDEEQHSAVPRVDSEALQTGGGVCTSGWLSATPAEATKHGELLATEAAETEKRVPVGGQVVCFAGWSQSAVSAVYLAAVISCSPILRNCAASRPICHDSVPLKKVSGLFLMCEEMSQMSYKQASTDMDLMKIG